MKLRYKYRIYPNDNQITQLRKSMGSTRWIWNYMLNQNNIEYASTKKFIWYYDMAMQLPELKIAYPWLKETTAQVLQQSLKELDGALKHVKIRAYPKFKKKGSESGIRYVQHVKFTDKKVYLPKIGWINIIFDRSLPINHSSVTVTCDVDRWFISVVCEVEDQQQVLIDRDNCVGIDLGIKAFAVTSDQEIIPSPKFLKQSLNKLKWKQRKLSHRKIGSNNRNKERIKVAKLHRKIRNQRLNFLHQTSRRLVNIYDLICCEDLKTKDLLKRKNRAMNRAISDQGWSMFLNMLKYKCQLYGKHFSQVSQWAASTKTCHVCNHKHTGFGLGIRIWICSNCKATLDRDLNAAQNIAFWGPLIIDNSLFKNTVGTTEIEACGDVPLTSMKQESMPQSA